MAPSCCLAWRQSGPSSCLLRRHAMDPFVHCAAALSPLSTPLVLFLFCCSAASFLSSPPVSCHPCSHAACQAVLQGAGVRFIGKREANAIWLAS